MKQPKHLYLSDLHGYSRLLVDATLGVTDLVEAMHHTILRLPPPVGQGEQKPTLGPPHDVAYNVLKSSSGLVYHSIRGIARLVGSGLDAAFAQLAPELEQLPSTQERAAVLSVLNGVLGDHMAARNNPLTIQMDFRHDGLVLPLTTEALNAAIPEPKDKILLMLHGHCMSELQWRRNGHDHGQVLAAANGYTPLYLRYNTGLHVSQNGRMLADKLEQLVRVWGVPLTDISIIGYSMGGLLARSACHYGAEAGHTWRQQVRQLFCIGTPHHGSMVEQAGNLTDHILEVSPYSRALSRLGKIRSAGTTDLRHGNVLDEDWVGRNRFAHIADVRHPLPLPDNIQCYAIAALMAEEHCEIRGKLIGDGLVPLNSALGRHSDPQRVLAFDEEHQAIVYGTSHMALLNSHQVCDHIQDWMARPPAL